MASSDSLTGELKIILWKERELLNVIVFGNLQYKIWYILFYINWLIKF